MTQTKAGLACIESLPVAAACLASGCTLQKVIPVSSGRVEFILAGKDADIIASDYILGKLEVNARDFMKCFDDLRTAVKAVRK